MREGGYAPLRLRNPERLLKKWTPKTFAEGEVRPVVIGIDAGSTGLKIAIIDAVTGALLYKEYAFNGDNQLAALDAMMKRVKQEIGAHIDVLHTAVTGSGRNAVAVMLGKPTVRTEILAHKTGVLETFKELGIKPTTYWELGGQDSKSMSLEQFIMAMNDLCSAGSVRSSKRWRNALASTRTKTAAALDQGVLATSAISRSSRQPYSSEQVHGLHEDGTVSRQPACHLRTSPPVSTWQRRRTSSTTSREASRSVT